MKAHRYAYGKEGSIGSGHGGPATKVHGLCDSNGIWHRLILSPGNCHDAPFGPLLVYNVQFQYLIADRAYDNHLLRHAIETIGATAVIPSKRNRKVQFPLDKARYKRRHIIENAWLALKDNCRLALRRDKYDATFASFLALAAAMSNLKKLVT
jgi:transposase